LLTTPLSIEGLFIFGEHHMEKQVKAAFALSEAIGLEILNHVRGQTQFERDLCLHAIRLRKQPGLKHALGCAYSEDDTDIIGKLEQVAQAQARDGLYRRAAAIVLKEELYSRISARRNFYAFDRVVYED
jgi:hypothetical protein